MDIRTRIEEAKTEIGKSTADGAEKRFAAYVRNVKRETIGRYGALEGKEIVECDLFVVARARMNFDGSTEVVWVPCVKTDKKVWIAKEEAKYLEENAVELFGEKYTATKKMDMDEVWKIKRAWMDEAIERARGLISVPD
jgi:hypothetical protein